MNGQVTQLESFLDNVVQQKVTDAATKEAAARAEVAEIENLIVQLKGLIDRNAGQVDMLSDLGSEIFVKTRINDTNKMLCELMHQFYLEMPLPEMITFMTNKLDIYRERHAHTLESLAEAKAELRLFAAALAKVAGNAMFAGKT